MNKSKVSPNNRNENHVFKSAVLSRIFLLTLILLWRALLSPYDTSAPLNPDCLSNNSKHQEPLFPTLATAIESSIVWDGVYYARIAQCGYEYEHTYAFLPLLPICISFLTRSVFAPLVPIIGQRAVIGLSGYVINNIAFVLASVYFYRLSVIILKDPEAALRASVLFCFNPASIFFSSIYSESLYALFSVGGLYYLMLGNNSIAVFFLALSGFARSNGVLNAGYICFKTMHQVYGAVLNKRVLSAMLVTFTGALQCICIFAPFIAFQAYGFNNICLGRDPDTLRPWCKARIPLLYNYIQSHYWGIGFLQYFQLKQLPNFLLASPILSLAFCSIVHYAKSDPRKFFSLGFHSPIEDNSSTVVGAQVDLRPSAKEVKEKSISNIQESHNQRLKKKIMRGEVSVLPEEPNKSSAEQGYMSVLVLPFILHLGFMSATAFFVMHVQVATRFLSSSPPLYWFASYLMKHPGRHIRWGYLIWTYSAAYILLGIEMDFLNGSPNYVTVALLGCLFLFPRLDKEGLSPWQKIPGNNTIHCGDYV